MHPAQNKIPFSTPSPTRGEPSIGTQLEHALSEAMANVRLTESQTPPRPSVPPKRPRRPSVTNRSSNESDITLRGSARLESKDSRGSPPASETVKRSTSSGGRSPSTHVTVKTTSGTRRPSASREHIRPASAARGSQKAGLTTTPKGLSERQRVKNALQLKKLDTLRVEAMAFTNKPLPATPESVAPTPVEMYNPTSQEKISQHRHTRSASSGKVLPAPSPKQQSPLSPTSQAKLNRQSQRQHSRGSSSLDSGSSPGADGLAHALRLRSGSVITLVPPEQTAWRRSSYVPGPIKLQQKRVHALQDADEAFGVGDFTNYGNFGANLDIFKDVLGETDGASVSTRKSDDAVLDDVVVFMESFGFDPVSFTGDEFWLEPEQRSNAIQHFHNYRTGTSVSSASASLPPYSPYGNPPRRLSASGLAHWASHRNAGPIKEKDRESWNSWSSGSTGHSHSRPLPPSPIPPMVPPKYGDSPDRERRTVSKGSKAGGIPGREAPKIGVWRLLKGAGSIV
ncbi:hypothetical protein NA57DRAFT_55299 [Rhizodiscina lignyota]|uniref:Uncharacterized protein n=1 Tax=Rhizodiscina lignyota TaxID=1504668 RepID=A0A9P4M6I9_9PEZI|nr:hypothetical protein NA57DRAFT_55299 [Rhizodiscina lignyota]